jgi:hypothetical protein
MDIYPAAAEVIRDVPIARPAIFGRSRDLSRAVRSFGGKVPDDLLHAVRANGSPAGLTALFTPDPVDWLQVPPHPVLLPSGRRDAGNSLCPWGKGWGEGGFHAAGSNPCMCGTPFREAPTARLYCELRHK